MGGMLTGAEIRAAYHRGEIKITPFDDKKVGINSYDLSIGNTYRTYHRHYLNPRDPQTMDTKECKIPDTGTVIYPGDLLLIPTHEVIGSDHYIPLVTGRSSLGRAGVQVHQEAGFGDIGFHGKWTLQVTCTIPYVLYPYIRIGQVYFITPVGDIAELYHGKYNGATDAISSHQFEDPELK